MKILVNRCYGGFGISDKAFEEYLNRTGQIFFKEEEGGWGNSYYKVPAEEYKKIFNEEKASKVSKDRYKRSNELHLSSMDISRTDLILIQIVEEMGEESFGMCSELEIVEIPDDIQYTIEEYDGLEHVAEVHRTW